MKTIYKYRLFELSNLCESTSLFLPSDAEILSVKLQDNIICLWEMHSIDVKDYTEFHFELFGTGWDIPDGNRIHLASIQTPNQFVWHIFRNKRNFNCE